MRRRFNGVSMKFRLTRLLAYHEQSLVSCACTFESTVHDLSVQQVRTVVVECLFLVRQRPGSKQAHPKRVSRCATDGTCMFALLLLTAAIHNKDQTNEHTTTPLPYTIHKSKEHSTLYTLPLFTTPIVSFCHF